MAHQVRVKMNTTVVLRKDLRIDVRSTRSGKIGTLLVSKGNVEWLPSGSRVKRRQLSWGKFARFMEKHGRPIRKR